MRIFGLVASVGRYLIIQTDCEKDYILYHIDLNNFDYSNFSFWYCKYYG